MSRHVVLLSLTMVTLTFGAASAAAAQETPAQTGASEGSTTGQTQAVPAQSGQPDGGPAVTTTLTVDGQPIEGVRISVRRDGADIGEALSDADGLVIVPVGAAGQVEVTLDVETLPSGVTVATDARTTLKPFVQETGRAPVVFRLIRGTEADASPSTFTRLAGLTFSGLRFGLVIAVAAVGLSLLFGTTQLTNFAHGEMVTFGAIATWYLNDPGGIGLPLVLAAIVGVAVSGGFGAALELGCFRPLRRRGMGMMSIMVVSIGLGFVLRYTYNIVFGANPKQYAQYAAQSPTVSIGSVDLRPKDLIVMAVALLVLVAVGLFLQRSRLGTAIRAVSDNADLAASSGIDVQRVILTVWILAGALAGLGGVLLGSTETVSWNMGQRALLVMFAAVVVGGLGTTFGAMVGGILVGLVSDLSTFWLDPDLKIVVALGSLIVVLMFRPQGIFGVRERTG